MTDKEKVINTLIGIAMTLDTDNLPDDAQAVMEAVRVLKAQEPRQAKHIHEEYPEHFWKRKEDGEIDEFAYEGDFHNGPVCVRCGDSFCKHCEPDGYETHRHCVTDKYVCPNCERLLTWGVNYCSNCGQGVKW